MKLIKAKLKGVFIIKPDVFEDFRGEYTEIYNEDFLKKNGINIHFVQDDFCISQKNVLRGIHGDDETWKIITCPSGRFYLVIVDCDPKSSNFGKWESFILSDKNHLQVLVPPKFGNAHLILSETAIFHYKQSSYYNRKKQFTFKFNDKKFNIWWPVKDPILSERDQMTG